MLSAKPPLEFEPDLKRLRTGDMSLDTEISLLNESGVMKLRDGKIDDAQHFFVKALDCFISKKRPTGGAHCLSTITLPENTGNHIADLLSDAMDYDDGLQTYTDAMTLGDDVCDSMQSTTLYFNVAQTFIFLRQYQEALSWLELALMCITIVSSSNKSTVIAAAKVLHNMGYCFSRLGRSDEAADAFHKTLCLATENSLDRTFSAAARNATALLGFYSDALNEDVLNMFRESLRDYEEVVGKESKEVATVLNNMGRVYYADGNCKDALDVYQNALSIRRRLLSYDSIDVAGTICSTGLTFHHLGELDSAKGLYLEFLTLAETRQYNIRDIAVISKNLAEIFRKNNDHAMAHVHYERALEAGKAGFGPNHLEVASILNRLGNLFYESNDLKKSLQMYQESMAIEKLSFHSTHTRIVITLSNVAQILYQMGELSDALATYKKVHTIQLQVHGRDSLEVAKSLSTIGEIEYKLNNVGTAFTLFQDVLVIQRVCYGKDSECLEISSTLNSIGIVSCCLGEFKVAQTCFTSSLSIRQNELGDHNDTATLWYNLATVHDHIGDEDLAITMYEECLRIESKTDGKVENDVIDSLQRLSRLHQRRGESVKAVSYLQKGLATLRSRDKCDDKLLAKFYYLLGNVHHQCNEIAVMMQCYTEAFRIHDDTGTFVNEKLIQADYYLLGMEQMHPPSSAAA